MVSLSLKKITQYTDSQKYRKSQAQSQNDFRQFGQFAEHYKKTDLLVVFHFRN